MIDDSSTAPSSAVASSNIRYATSTDVADMVVVHLESFPGFFLTFLGPGFLKVLYSSILEVPDNISLVLVSDNNKVEGFVVGTLSPEGLYKRLLVKNWFNFALASVLPALRNPSCIPRLLRAFSTPKTAKLKSADCLLMSIGVLPNKIGTGAGRMLVEEFLGLAGQRGANSVSLTTDRDNNDSVNRFYEKTGFKLDRSFVTPEGRQMNEYLFDFAPSS